MKRTWATAGLLVALTCFGLNSSFGQQSERDESEQQQTERERKQGGQERESASNREKKSSSERSEKASSRSSRNQGQESEIRLRYDDKTNRLYIDVDEAIQFRNDRKAGKDGGWARDGEFDLRYDTDRQDLKVAGEGTIDVDRAAGSVARWWQSWWEEERTARRTRQQSSESGARLFIRQHDEDGDDRLSRMELPQRHRDEFDRVDANSDGELSQAEIQRYGDSTYDAAQRLSREGSSRGRTSTARSQANSDDQTWSQWWASWWSDQDQAGQSREQIAALGAREFINRHDENDDGELVRSELPHRMYDDFERLDENGDRRLVRSEIERIARRSDPNQNEERTSRSDDRRR